MEGQADQLPFAHDPLSPQQRVEAASEFLSICDGAGRPASLDGLRQWLLLGRCATSVTHCGRSGAMASLKGAGHSIHPAAAVSE